MSKRDRERIGLLKVGEIAMLAGLAATAVRFYTQMGLLPMAAETPGGCRLYHRDVALNRLETIKAITGRQWTLLEIRRALETA